MRSAEKSESFLELYVPSASGEPVRVAFSIVVVNDHLEQRFEERHDRGKYVRGE